MKRHLLVVVCAMAVLACASPVMADGGGITLLAAQRVAPAGTGGEISTTAAPLPNGNGGFLFYNQNVNVPGSHNVLMVTVSAVGDSHGGTQSDLACIVDGTKLCEPFTQIVPETPSGWVSVQRFYLPNSTFTGDGGGGGGDWHDNTINQKWCVSIPGKKGEDDDNNKVTHNVELKLAANSIQIPHSTGPAFLDDVKVYIESARVEDATLACAIKTTIP